MGRCSRGGGGWIQGGDVRKKLAGMSENALGWAISRVGFARDIFGVDGKLSGE